MEPAEPSALHALFGLYVLVPSMNFFSMHEVLNEVYCKTFVGMDIIFSDDW
jgi:hypothetical protein